MSVMGWGFPATASITARQCGGLRRDVGHAHNAWLRKPRRGREAPQGYHPGYGKYLVDEGVEPHVEAPPVPTPQEIEVLTQGGPSRPLQVGETWNPITGEITPAPTPEPEVAPE